MDSIKNGSYDQYVMAKETVNVNTTSDPTSRLLIHILRPLNPSKTSLSFSATSFRIISSDLEQLF